MLSLRVPTDSRERRIAVSKRHARLPSGLPMGNTVLLGAYGADGRRAADRSHLQLRQLAGRDMGLRPPWLRDLPPLRGRRPRGMERQDGLGKKEHVATELCFFKRGGRPFYP